MSDSRLNLLQQLRKMQADPGYARDLWHDWFCKDTQLEARQAKLVSFLYKVVVSKKFDAEKVYAFFKNNAPASNHPLYDSFSLVELDGDVLFHVAFGDKRAEGYVQVSSKAKDYEFEFCGDVAGAVKFFKEV